MIRLNNLKSNFLLKDHLIEIFHFPEVENDTICENDRKEFFLINRKEKLNVESNIR